MSRCSWQSSVIGCYMAPIARPLVSGKIVNPNNAGGPVAFGDTVQNCGALSALYAAGPTNVTGNSCATFTLSGPFVAPLGTDV